MTTRAVGLRRLLKLADFLETLPRKRFDYDRWIGGDWKGNPDLSCGTTACALGWATTIPSLRRAGLRLVGHGQDWNSLSPGSTADLKDPIGVAIDIFSLTNEEASEVFLPATDQERHATPKYVAKKIRRFVKQAREKSA